MSERRNNNNNNSHNNNSNENRRRGGGRQNQNQGQKQEGPKREAILDLNKYKDQQIRVKFIGGRQITGILKGFDQLMNLVLEQVEENLRDEDDDTVLTSKTRQFQGLVVVRCTSLLTISPVDGSEIIDNPYVVEAQ